MTSAGRTCLSCCTTSASAATPFATRSASTISSSCRHTIDTFAMLALKGALAPQTTLIKEAFLLLRSFEEQGLSGLKGWKMQHCKTAVACCGCLHIWLVPKQCMEVIPGSWLSGFEGAYIRWCKHMRFSRLEQLERVHHVMLRQPKHANKATPPDLRAGKPWKERIQRRSARRLRLPAE